MRRGRGVVVVGVTLVAVLLLPSPVVAQTTTTRTDRLIAATRAVVGGTTLGTTSPMQIVGLPTGGGAACVAVDANGNLYQTTGGTCVSGYPRLDQVLDPTAAKTFNLGGYALNFNGATVGVGSNFTVGGTLGVTGAATLSSTAAITGNTTIGDSAYLSRVTYASQTTGWRIGADGSADFRYVFVDELHAKAFIADLEQALAGGQIISKSVAVVSSDFTCPAAGGTTILSVADLPSAPNMAVFQSGDHVALRSFARAGGGLTIDECLGVVTDYANQTDNTQTWLFTRGAASCSGAMAGGGVVPKDALVLDFGVPGNGYAEVNAIDGVYAANSPYYQLVTWSGSCPSSSNRAVRARYGNLSGAYNYSTGSNIFGLAVGDGGASNLTIDPTNGIRIRYGTTDKLVADTSGNLNLTGDLVMGTAGVIRSGATSATVGTGYWLAYNAGTPVFRIGTYSATAGASSYLYWDGTSLTFDTPEAQMKSGEGLFVKTASALATSSTTAIGVNLATRGSLTVTGNVASIYSTGAGATGEVVIEKGCGNDSSCAGVTSTVRVRARNDLAGLGRVLLDAPSTQILGEGRGLIVDAGTGSDKRVGLMKYSGYEAALVAGSGTVLRLGHRTDAANVDVALGTFRPELIVDTAGATKPGADASFDLGTSAARWSEIYADPTSTTAAYSPLVINSSGQVLKKTDGVNVTVDCSSNGVATITVEEGIVTNVTCR